jgi:hypothetical protein
MAGRIYGTLRRAEAMGNRKEDFLWPRNLRQASGKVLVNVAVWRTIRRRTREKNGRPFCNRETCKAVQLLTDIDVRLD